MPQNRRRVKGKLAPTSEKAVVKHLTRMMKGLRFTCPPQPPPFTSRPWYSQIIRVEGVPSLVTNIVLYNNLASTLGVSGSLPAVQMRLQSIRIWGPIVSFDSGPMTRLSVTFLDFIGVVTAQQPPRVLEEFTRYPDQTSRPSIGYRYDETHRHVALNSGTAVSICSSVGVANTSVMYAHVLWRFDQNTSTLVDSEDDEISVISHLDKRRSKR